MIPIVISALLLGVFGSLHCVGMCGPIALALPLTGASGFTKLLSLLVYNIGRALTYGLFGVLFGLIGSGFAFFGLQQILSVTLGILILVFILLPKSFTSRFFITVKIYNVLGNIKSTFSDALRKSGLPALFMIGVLNGLLPCGLVYMAVAGAIATGDWASGGAFMILFGLGTMPAMLALSWFSNVINLKFKIKVNKVMPYLVSVMALMMILRGLNLGIPYLSPSFKSKNNTVECCDKKNGQKCSNANTSNLSICCTKK